MLSPEPLLGVNCGLLPLPTARSCPCTLPQAPGCCFVGRAHSDVGGDEGWLAGLEHAAGVSASGVGRLSGCSATCMACIASACSASQPSLPCLPP